MIRRFALCIALALGPVHALEAAAQPQPEPQPITEVLKLKLVERTNNTIAETYLEGDPLGSNDYTSMRSLAASIMDEPDRVGLSGLILSAPEAKLVKLPTLWVSGLRPDDRSICIDIRSVDGQEYARGTVDLPLGQAYARLIRLDYDPIPKKLASRIRNSAKSSPWRAKEFVVVARVSRRSRCTGGRTYIPVSLGQKQQKPPSLTLLIKGGDPTSILEAELPTVRQPTACQRMNTAGNSLVRGYVTYTHACTVPVPVDRCGTDLLVTINAETGSGRFPTGNSFIVRAPCTP